MRPPNPVPVQLPPCRMGLASASADGGRSVETWHPADRSSTSGHPGNQQHEQVTPLGALLYTPHFFCWIIFSAAVLGVGDEVIRIHTSRVLFVTWLSLASP